MLRATRSVHQLHILHPQECPKVISFDVMICHDITWPYRRFTSNRNNSVCLLDSMLAKQPSSQEACHALATGKDDQNSLVRKDSDLLHTNRQMWSTISVHIIYTTVPVAKAQPTFRTMKKLESNTKDSAIRCNKCILA